MLKQFMWGDSNNVPKVMIVMLDGHVALKLSVATANADTGRYEVFSEKKCVFWKSIHLIVMTCTAHPQLSFAMPQAELYLLLLFYTSRCYESMQIDESF